ncbi:hypothetical protein POM88_001068 [Heracleum sosnowskyi]|uniref:Replication factor A C-terminal domain-containing protein n=1 Tax=Heracleum sosnowskyi TaxID=360622 RepID=A0AAD8NBF0_9APIA|nr:hypothetical protein POM88_001068 [Heracleum sosnowskyi]
MDQRPYTKISALVNNSDKAVMYMRATRIWRSFNPYDKKPLYTNVILMDEEGNHIWAMIRNNQRATYMKTLEEDKDFGKINELVGDVRFFIDVIGWVVSYGDVYTTEKGFKKLDVQLLNDRCTQSNSKRHPGNEAPPGKEFMRCLCEAKIIDIVADDGWSYNCCSACNRGVTFVDGKYRCRACTLPPSVKQGYRVSVTVEDSSGTTTFTLFNKDAELLIGVPIERLITEIEEVHLSNDIPAVVGNIVGKTCAFEVKVTSYNISRQIEDYVVAKVTDCQNTPRTETNGDEASSSSTKKRKMA